MSRAMPIGPMKPRMTGYLAVYPANANDPKSSFSVLAPRQALVVRLAKGDGGLRALSAELKPRAGDGDDEGFHEAAR